MGDNGMTSLLPVADIFSLRQRADFEARMTREPRVSCVIVNWNGWADTLACLESLRAQEYGNLHTIVVDNGSTNDSVARIRAGFPEVEVIDTGKNLGFAAGTNVGMRKAMADGAEYIWALNNDTIAPPDTLTKLVAKAKATPGVGAVGTVLYYMHDPGQVQAWGGGRLKVWLARSHHFTGPATFGDGTFLTFASVLLPRCVIEQVGLLYEGYFMYFDDADFALRLRRAGFGITVAEDTAVLHKEGGSAEVKRSPVIDRFYFASGLHFLRRYAAWPGISMVCFLAPKLAKRVMKGEWKNVGAGLRAVGDYRSQRGRTYVERL